MNKGSMVAHLCLQGQRHCTRPVPLAAEPDFDDGFVFRLEVSAGRQAWRRKKPMACVGPVLVLLAWSLMTLAAGRIRHLVSQPEGGRLAAALRLDDGKGLCRFPKRSASNRLATTSLNPKS